MNCTRRIVVFCLLFVSLLSLAQSPDSGRIQEYAERYVQMQNRDDRLALANNFFAYLLQVGYIDEPIVFPAESHMDSVDVNVYYYIAEYYYSEGNYRTAADFCARAEKCFGEVDDLSKSDIYALLGAAYFRMSEYDKATEALYRGYELDKASGDLDRTSSDLNSIASAFVAAGKPHEAEKYIMEAIAANSLTKNHARMAVNRHRDPLGWALLSFFVSPLLTWIILLIVGDQR